MDKKVLLTEPIQPIGIDILKKQVEVVIAPNPEPNTIESMIKDFDGLISRNTYIGKAILSKAKKLKVIASHGVGTDHIDICAATKHGVFVVNTPGANAQSVAEAVIGLLLSICRKICEGNNALKINHDFYHRDKCLGTDLYNKTIGIIGMGNIGRKLANICIQGFKMRVLYYDPFVAQEEIKEKNVFKVEELDNIFIDSDFVSLNCPYTHDLHHMVDKDKLSLMKPTAYLINCARGSLIDQKALYDALKNHKIAGAALDVYAQEPPDMDNPLFALDNIVTTPHIAAFSKDSINRMSLISAQDVLHILNGESNKANVVNKNMLNRVDGLYHNNDSQSLKESKCTATSFM